ncbi:MAG: hypothetical protein Q9214_002987, partial [Letrouitia sp. 1 TL-2023]
NVNTLLASVSSCASAAFASPGGVSISMFGGQGGILPPSREALITGARRVGTDVPRPNISDIMTSDPAHA